MKINAKETAASLGHKLADLDLSDGEALLLATLLGEESEVEGFLDKSSTKLQEFRPLVTAPGGKPWIIIESYTEVEWTY